MDQQVSARGYSSSSGYVRELIRKDQDRQGLRGLLLEGAASPPAGSHTALFGRARCVLPNAQTWFGRSARSRLAS